MEIEKSDTWLDRDSNADCSRAYDDYCYYSKNEKVCAEYCLNGDFLPYLKPGTAKRRITPVKDQNYVTRTATKTTACRGAGYAFAVEAVLEAEFISGYSVKLDDANREGYGGIPKPTAG